MILKCTLLYCGIPPSEIEKMDGEEAQLFLVYFKEMMREKSVDKKNGRRT